MLLLQLGNAAGQGPNHSDAAVDVAGGRLLVLAYLQAVNIKNTVKQALWETSCLLGFPFAQSHLSEPNSVVPPVRFQRLVSEHQQWGEKDAPGIFLRYIRRRVFRTPPPHLQRNV